MNAKIFNDFTLLVTPHEDSRYKNLYRFLEYYSQFNYPFKIIILNSCQSDINKSYFNSLLNHKSIKHFKFDHSTKALDKFIKGLHQTQTKYCSIIAEDDIHLLSGVLRGLNCLNENTDASAFVGDVLLYSKASINSNNGEPKIKFRYIYKPYSLVEDIPHQRIEKYFSKYTFPMFHSIYKTRQWEEALEITNSSIDKDDHRFGEILPSLIMAAKGKILYTNHLLSLRSYDPDSISRTIKSYGDYVVDGTFNKRYTEFKTTLVSFVSNIEMNSSRKEIEMTIDKAADSFLSRSVKSMILKARIASLLQSFGLLNFVINVKTALRKNPSVSYNIKNHSFVSIHSLKDSFERPLPIDDIKAFERLF